jgi:hypothetical protein
MQTFTAKLKTRKQLEKIRDTEGYVDAWGWWSDVCPGKTLQLREATASDLARCHLRDNASQDPKAWLCETFERGSLVSRAAVAKLTPNAAATPVQPDLARPVAELAPN